MADHYSLEEKNLVERKLCDLFPPEWLREKAKDTGLIKRERRIDPVIMFWVLAIGYGSFLRADSCQPEARTVETVSSQFLSDSSWYYRFAQKLVVFLRECVAKGLEYLVQEPRRALNKRLTPFKDALMQDGTIVRLNEKPAKILPAARSCKAAAGVKVAVLISAIASSPSMALFAENTNGLKMLRVGPWIKDCVLLIDLGFYRCQIFTRIKENGGYFVSRLKRNANPLFIEAIGSIAAEVSPYVESTSKSSLRI